MLTGFSEKPFDREEKGIRREEKHVIRRKLESIDKRRGAEAKAYTREWQKHFQQITFSLSQKLSTAAKNKQKKTREKGKMFLHTFDSFSWVINYRIRNLFSTRFSLFYFTLIRFQYLFISGWLGIGKNIFNNAFKGPTLILGRKNNF